MYNYMPATGVPQGWVCISHCSAMVMYTNGLGAAEIRTSSTNGMGIGDPCGVETTDGDIWWKKVQGTTNKPFRVRIAPALPADKESGFHHRIFTYRFINMPSL